MERGKVRMDEDEWVTINGTHVLVGENGTAKSGGKLKGKTFKHAKSSKSSGQESGGETFTGEAPAAQASAKPSRIASLPRAIQVAHAHIKNLTLPFYNNGKKTARDAHNPALESYTDHWGEHIRQVCEKSLAAADALDTIFKGNDAYGNIDRKLLLCAAQLHDIGMDGGDFMDFSDDDGNRLRKMHPINSAIHILKMRDQIEKEGLDADKLALLVMAHSKSSSRISDLTSDEDWRTGIGTLMEYTDDYNMVHPDKKIEFNPDFLVEQGDFGEGEKQPLKADALKDLRACVTALRLGDANRDAPDDDHRLTQGGAKIKFDPKTSNNKATSPLGEVDDMDIKIEYPDGTVKTLGEGTLDPHEISKQVYVGEGNLKSIDCINQNGKITERFVVDDGRVAPYCTAQAITERFGELETMRGAGRAVEIVVNGKYTDEEKEEIRNKYMEQFDDYGDNQKKHPFYKELGVSKDCIKFEDEV